MCRYAAEMVEALSKGQDASDVREKERNMDNESKYKLNVLNGMGEDIQLSQREANPSAKVLRPFLDWLEKRMER